MLESTETWKRKPPPAHKDSDCIGLEQGLGLECANISHLQPHNPSFHLLRLCSKGGLWTREEVIYNISSFFILKWPSPSISWVSPGACGTPGCQSSHWVSCRDHVAQGCPNTVPSISVYHDLKKSEKHHLRWDRGINDSCSSLPLGFRRLFFPCPMSSTHTLPTARDEVGLGPVTLPPADGCWVAPVKRNSLAKLSGTSFGPSMLCPGGGMV